MLKNPYQIDARYAYLRLMAHDVICRLFPEMKPSEIQITQIGKDGFYFKLPCDLIPRAMVRWVGRVKKANEGFF